MLVLDACYCSGQVPRDLLCCQSNVDPYGQGRTGSFIYANKPREVCHSKEGRAREFVRWEMATGVSFENFTGHVMDVDWPAVVAGVTVYGEWESPRPPSEASPEKAGYRATEITGAYYLSRMAVVPQTFADFTANFWRQLVVRHFSHTAGGGKRHVSTSNIMTWCTCKVPFFACTFLASLRLR